MFGNYSLLDGETALSPAALTCGPFAGGSIRVRTEPMLRINGYTQLDRVHPHVYETVRQMASRAEVLFRPGIWYRMLRIKAIEGNRMTLDAGTTLHCGELAPMARCAAVVVFILTMGEPFDNEAQRLSSNGKVLERLFFETAGWLGVEAATKSFAGRLRQWSEARGYALTRRFAPGYDPWPLADQQSLFSLFQGIALPVRLLESCVMVPAMSRSGMYGLRPGGQFE